MKLILLPVLFLLSSELVAQTSYVAPTKILGKGAYQLSLSAEMFKSSKRIDEDGNDVKFEDGESFSRLQGEVGGLYGLTENLQIGGGARFRQNNSTFFNTATSEEESESSTGIDSTFVSLMYAFKPVGRLQYTLEGMYRYTPYTNEESLPPETGSLILGDEGNEYSFGLGVTYSTLTNNFLTGRVGYRSPGKDLASEIYWLVEGALAWKYVALVAGIDGVTSMKNDPFEDTPEDRPIYNRGSTFLYHSQNREWIAPYAGLNVSLGEKWRVDLRGKQVVSGKSTDLGTAFGLTLVRRMDDKAKKKVDQTFKEYDFEASVTKISPKQGFLIIDKGVVDDVQKGMKIDFFEFDYVGGNILIARGIVIQSKAETAIVKLTHRYNNKKPIKEGMVARGSFK